MIHFNDISHELCVHVFLIHLMLNKYVLKINTKILLQKESVCGVCVPPEKAQPLQREALYECEEKCETSPEDMFDLPFCVKVGAWPSQNEDDPYEKAFPRNGASRCIRPSNFHDLQSVHRENFRDFFKL